ncbi:hypothetical protein PT974_04368 [Cladobotryum mycophilum]|uniref:Uncharacterized protein n=1 Tax=Cladobotryum mycophilum TaxID=491253 RepID=A0ABR0SUY4_9HYPO
MARLNSQLSGVFFILNLFFACILGSQLRLSEQVGYIGEQVDLSEQAALQQLFDPTKEEIECLYGGPRTRPWPVTSDPIPNIVHFVLLQGAEDGDGAGEFDFLSYLAVRSALVSLKPEAVYLHVLTSKPRASDAQDSLLDNPWIQRLKDNITIIHHSNEGIEKRRNPAYAADMLRLEILHEQGGIYLDLDVISLRPFTNILNSPPPKDVVVGFVGGNRLGLGSGVVAARRNSPLIHRWLSTYPSLTGESNFHPAMLPKSLSSQSHPQELCTLPPTHSSGRPGPQSTLTGCTSP